MPCKNTIKGKDVANMFFEKVLGALWDTKEHHLI
jgi:hypothetical protein